MATFTRTFTRTHVYIPLANPFLVCVGCGASVRRFHNHERCGCDAPRLDRNPCCGAYGQTSTCPSWGPVDGCTCAATLGSVDHPPAAGDG